MGPIKSKVKQTLAMARQTAATLLSKWRQLFCLVAHDKGLNACWVIAGELFHEVYPLTKLEEWAPKDSSTHHGLGSN